MQGNIHPRFILFAGLAGSGKSTLATELSRHMHRAIVVRKDLITDQLILAGDDIDAASWRAFEVAFALCADLLSQSISPILDVSNLRPFVNERAAQIAEKANVALHVIHCRLDPEVRLTRIIERHPTPVQQRAGNYHDPSTHFLHLPDARLVIDTALPLDICLQQILAYLDVPV